MDYEYTVLQKHERVCVFKLPNLTSSKGHYLEDWKDMIWEGGIKVASKGNVLMVYLVSKDKSVFGTAPIPLKTEEAVHRTVDSMRGFALRLQATNGKYAWIGLCFRDRNDAFDFTVCLQDFKEKQDLEKNPEKLEKEFQVTKNFSLEPGKKLNLNFGQTSGSTENQGFQGFSGFEETSAKENKPKDSFGFGENIFSNQNNVPKNQGLGKEGFGDFNFGDWNLGNNSNSQNQTFPNQNFNAQPKKPENKGNNSENLIDLF